MTPFGPFSRFSRKYPVALDLLREQKYSVESAAICRLVASKVLKQVLHWNCCSTVGCRNLKNKNSTITVNYAE